MEPTGLPALPPELTAKEQEVRRLVDAGASSPEELRALAARLQEQRSYEDDLWRREVRPALMQSKKRRFGGVTAGEPRRDDRGTDRDSLQMAALLAGGIIVMLLIATLTTMWFLVIPVVGVLVYAWVHGRRVGAAGEAPAPPPDATD